MANERGEHCVGESASQGARGTVWAGVARLACLASVVATGCAALPPTGPQAPDSRGVGAASDASETFVPEAADAARKAKLLAVASRLDAHFASDLSS